MLMTTFSKDRWALLVLTIFLASAFASAQLPAINPAPGQSDGVIGPQLIAWSALQKLQPVPQQQTQTEPSQQNQALSEGAQQPEPETQQTTAQSVTGIISKIGGQYVLQMDDNITYQLDDPANVGQYMGKHVKVTGVLDRTTGIIRVRSIELIS
jgi:hypothetical protein